MRPRCLRRVNISNAGIDTGVAEWLFCSMEGSKAEWAVAEIDSSARAILESDFKRGE